MATASADYGSASPCRSQRSATMKCGAYHFASSKDFVRRNDDHRQDGRLCHRSLQRCLCTQTRKNCITSAAVPHCMPTASGPILAVTGAGYSAPRWKSSLGTSQFRQRAVPSAMHGGDSYAMIVRRLVTADTPGAVQAARSASFFSTHERTPPSRTTAPPEA
jgi:hypothetical protein